MHDDRVNCIVFNAFNGFGGITGSDEFGYSAAWIDLDDYLEPEGLDHYELYPHSDDVSAYVKTLPALAGGSCCGSDKPHRYVLAFWDADGSRYVVAFCTRADLKAAFDERAAEFNTYESEGV